MRRSSFRRVIALAVVLCQLLAATVFHVPMAHAMSAMSTTAAHHCHNDGNPAPQPTDDSNHCKSGLCKCPCAQLPALSVELTPLESVGPRPPMTLADFVTNPPDRPTPFFRPPIA